VRLLPITNRTQRPATRRPLAWLVDADWSSKVERGLKNVMTIAPPGVCKKPFLQRLAESDPFFSRQPLSFPSPVRSEGFNMGLPVGIFFSSTRCFSSLGAANRRESADGIPPLSLT